MNTIVEQTKTTEISFGDKLRQTREALNLSLEDVAKAISLRPSILAKLENNEFVQKDVYKRQDMFPHTAHYEALILLKRNG